PSLSRSLPLHHCCSFISKRSTAPSLANGLFPNAPNSIPSRGIFFLRASHLVRVTFGQAPDGTIGPRRAPGSAIRQLSVFWQVPSPARKFRCDINSLPRTASGGEPSGPVLGSPERAHT